MQAPPPRPCPAPPRTSLRRPPACPNPCTTSLPPSDPVAAFQDLLGTLGAGPPAVDLFCRSVGGWVWVCCLGRDGVVGAGMGMGLQGWGKRGIDCGQRHAAHPPLARGCVMRRRACCCPAAQDPGSGGSGHHQPGAAALGRGGQAEHALQGRDGWGWGRQQGVSCSVAQTAQAVEEHASERGARSGRLLFPSHLCPSPPPAPATLPCQHLQDSMRERALGDIADAWCALLAAYTAPAPDTAAAVLETVQRYVHWIDIGLVANDRFVPLLFGALAAPQEGLRGAAADVLTEIVRCGGLGGAWGGGGRGGGGGGGPKECPCRVPLHMLVPPLASTCVALPPAQPPPHLWLAASAWRPPPS